MKCRNMWKYILGLSKLFTTLEEFGAIMPEHDFGAIILPTLDKDVSDLAHQLLGVPLTLTKRWCKSNKLNAFKVFKYFSKMDVPLVGVKCSQHLHAFCHCILAWFFLLNGTPCVDPRILHVIKNQGSGNPIAIILAKTLNGLDAIHREDTAFFAGSAPLLQV